MVFIMDIKSEFKKYRPLVDNALKEFLNKEIKSAKKLSPYAQLMAEHISEFSMRGGKRIRPILTIKAYEMLGGKQETEIVKASLSIELLQSYLLMHDDLMDRDALRRGKPSSWNYFSEYHKQNFSRKVPELFGNNMAVLAGDICNVFSVKAIDETNFNDSVKNQAISKLNEMNQFTGYGQVLDVSYEQKENVTIDEVLKMFELKTSHYTISGPLELGAIFAEADPEIIRTLANFGIPAGIAFQIHDDILGIYADKEKLGKPLGSDLSEGKRTLLIANVYSSSNIEKKEKILSFLGKPDISEKELEEVRKLIKEIGALEKTEDMKKQYVEKAMKIASSGNLSKEMQDFLKQFTNYLVSREY